MAKPFSIRIRNKAKEMKARIERGETVLMFSAADMRKPVMKALQAWCDDMGIGAPLLGSGGWRFTRDCLVALEETLALEKLAPLTADIADTRVEQVQQGGEEHKTQGEAPTEHRVLCSFPMPSKLCLPLRVSQSRCHVDMDWRRLNLAHCAGLVVVENLDVFYLYGSEQWPALRRLEHHWVVYRGHDSKARGVRQLQQAVAERGLPQVFFGDFDAKGVSLGLHEDYTHLLLPTVDDARVHASRWQASAAQVNAFPSIESHVAALPDTHPLHAYVALLREQKALLQQGMAGLPLTLVSMQC